MAQSSLHNVLTLDGQELKPDFALERFKQREQEDQMRNWRDWLVHSQTSIDAMRINHTAGSLELVNEPTYSFGSADNLRRYGFAKHLDSEYGPTSVHGLLLDGEPLAVFGDSGGCTGVHDHSAVLLGNLLFFAVGRHVVCLRPSPFEFRWALQTDPVTCFGVHYDQAHDALISHGELEISRFTQDGASIWSSSGADVFSEGFGLAPKYIEVRDFEGRSYRFDYADGNLRA